MDNQASDESLTCQLVYFLQSQTAGRRSLARQTGLSEMQVRLLLERLRRAGFLAVDRKGASLTQAGRRTYAPLLRAVKAVRRLRLPSLIAGPVTVAALVSHQATRPVWWYRDQAVREGAATLILLHCVRERWYFSHAEERLGIQNPLDEQVIEEAFPMGDDGDVLAIVSAPDRKRAGAGLWRVINEIILLNSHRLLRDLS